MADYPPPTETLPEFTPSVFSTKDDPLTIGEAEKFFVKFPTAQGAETLTDAVITGKLSTTNPLTKSLVYGYQTTETSGSGEHNTAFGYQAGKGYNTLTTGGGNSAFGGLALSSINTTSLSNTAIGANSLNLLTTGARNTAVGSFPITGGVITTGSDNVLVGNEATTGATNTNSTVAVGAGAKNTFNGVSVGNYAGASITTASNNIAIGKEAMGNQVTSFKTISGGSAINNVCIGNGCGKLMNGTNVANNVAVGTDAFGALQPVATNTTGTENTCIGHNAGGRIIGGIRNTIVGSLAGTNITSGGNNVCFGYNSGNTITTGADNICIGNGADCGSSGLSNAVAIGAGVIVSASNTIVLGTLGQTVFYEKVAPLYTTVPTTYNSTHIGFINTATITYPGATTNVIASYTAQAGTWIVSVNLNMNGGPTFLTIRNGGTTVGTITKITQTTDWYNSTTYTVVSTGTAVLDILPAVAGATGTNAGGAGQSVRFIRVA